MLLRKTRVKGQAEISIAIPSRMEMSSSIGARKSFLASDLHQVTEVLLVGAAVAEDFQAEGDEVERMTVTDVTVVRGMTTDGIEGILEMIGTTIRTRIEVYNSMGIGFLHLVALGRRLFRFPWFGVWEEKALL
jgi:hypothetical protein